MEFKAAKLINLRGGDGDDVEAVASASESFVVTPPTNLDLGGFGSGGQEDRGRRSHSGPR